MARRGMKNYNWCAKDGKVWYKDCERCRLHYYCDCDFRFKTHPDAVQKADMIRAAKGLPLFSKDFDAMKTSLQQGERTKRANLYGKHNVNRELQNNENATSKKSKDGYREPDWKFLWSGYLSAFISSSILAYVLQFCAIMTEWFFGILSSFLGLDDGGSWAKTVEDSFFYATYGQSYIYALVLQHLIFVWMLGGSGNRWANVLRFVVTAYFTIASIAISQLFISVAIGPLFIFFCFAITAKK